MPRTGDKEREERAAFVRDHEFCQNWEISMTDGSTYLRDKDSHYLAPDVLTDMADGLRDRGNIGVAFTYNEPTICWEYILDTAPLLQEKGLKTVLVTNGCVEDQTAKQLLPHVHSAMSN